MKNCIRVEKIKFENIKMSNKELIHTNNDVDYDSIDLISLKNFTEVHAWDEHKSDKREKELGVKVKDQDEEYTTRSVVHVVENISEDSLFDSSLDEDKDCENLKLDHNNFLKNTNFWMMKTFSSTIIKTITESKTLINPGSCVVFGCKYLLPMDLWSKIGLLHVYFVDENTKSLNECEAKYNDYNYCSNDYKYTANFIHKIFSLHNIYTSSNVDLIIFFDSIEAGFYTESTLETTMKNITYSLRSGGYMLVLLLNSNYILKNILSSDNLLFGNNFFSCFLKEKKNYNNNDFGFNIYLKLGQKTLVQNFVCLELFENVLNDIGMKKIVCKSLSDVITQGNRSFIADNYFQHCMFDINFPLVHGKEFLDLYCIQIYKKK